MARAYTKYCTHLSCLKLPYILIDYGKCDGDGACTTSCPGSIFEVSRDWCKPLDTFVKNNIALESFHEMVLPRNGPVPIALRYHVPECFLCWQCIGACPRQAIDVEYDDLDLREYIIATGNVATLTKG